ncbi:MAG: GGDEF domain-containing protein, partial [Gammaproteobacteria bacterium]|nr:GGDEF domain-containing protein [Gammaproteobacteria bacterium]
MDARHRLHVVVIDRSSTGADDLLGVLRQGGYAISGAVVDNPAALSDALRERPWDLVLATQRVPGFGIPRALTVLRAGSRDLPLVGIAPTRRDGEGVALLALGARDVVDPENRDHLLAVVRREVASLEDRRRLRRLERLHGLQPDRAPTGAIRALDPPELRQGPDVPGEHGAPWSKPQDPGESGRDYLTGLPNRGYFLETLLRFLDRPTPERTAGHLVLVELENFRALRQAGGITTCDAIVAELAEAVRREVTARDLLARFGDNSFSVLTGDQDAFEVDRLAERIRRAVKGTVVEVGGQFFATTCSIGVASVTPGISDLRVVLSRADQACRRAILAGGNQVRRFEASAGDGSVNLLRTVAPDVVWNALSEERMALLYQPIIPLHGQPRPFYQAHLCMLDRQGNPFPLDAIECASADTALSMKLDLW